MYQNDKLACLELHYDWASVKSVADTETGIPEKQDYRIFPTPTGHSLVCRCSAHLETNDLKQIGCKWFVESRGDKSDCKYDRFGIMCDKVTDEDGKGIN